MLFVVVVVVVVLASGFSTLQGGVRFYHESPESASCESSTQFPDLLPSPVRETLPVGDYRKGNCPPMIPRALNRSHRAGDGSGGKICHVTSGLTSHTKSAVY